MSRSRMTGSDSWPLPHDSVHVWRVPLDQAAYDVQQFSALLSDDERQRATRFRFEHLTRRYPVVRSAPKRVA